MIIFLFLFFVCLFVVVVFCFVCFFDYFFNLIFLVSEPFGTMYHHMFKKKKKKKKKNNVPLQIPFLNFFILLFSVLPIT